MMFICFKFAESHRSVSFAMAKSSFKLEHPLGSLKFSIFSYKINLFITIFLLFTHMLVLVNPLKYFSGMIFSLMRF